MNIKPVKMKTDQEVIFSYFKTKREKKLINFALQDFGRIHAQFVDKPRSVYIETQPYTLTENEGIKFKFRLYPSKHSLSIDAIYCGTDPSAQLFMSINLLDKEGRRFNFDFGRKIEFQLNNHHPESNGNFVYDRDDLEKKRDKLFTADKLSLQIEINATYIDISDSPSPIESFRNMSISGGDESSNN